VRDEQKAAEARDWLAENEDDSALTPERIAMLEAAAANDAAEAAPALEESESPVAGRRFSRA
jgi:(E)-4-hydroxy-3-methylbut-2-enyl-diphosphate synthase